MPRVAFKNIADTVVTYQNVDAQYLLGAIKAYARLQSNDIYKAIMSEKVSIIFNGKVLHPDNWAFLEVSESDEIIITPVLGDDVGAWIQVVIGAVLIVASLWDYGATGEIGVSLLMGGLALALGGISSLLFSPTLPALNFGESKGSQTYNWSGMKTIAQADSPIPIVYGTHKVAGNVISLFSEVEGNDNYLYMLLALAEGEIDGIVTKDDQTTTCTTSDQSSANYKVPAIEFDDQPIDYYTDVTWWYRTGTNTADGRADKYYPYSQNPIPNFEDSRVQLVDGRELTTTGIEYTTTKQVDMVDVKIQCPSLFSTASGILEAKRVDFRVQWRKNGDTAWNTDESYKWEVTKTAVGTTTNSLLTCTQFNAGQYIYHKPPAYTIKVLSNSYYYFTHPSDRENLYNIVIEITDSNNNVSEIRTITQKLSRELYISHGDEPDDWALYEGNFLKESYIAAAITTFQTMKYGPDIHTYTTFYIGDFQCTLSHDVSAGDSWSLSSTQLVDVDSVYIFGLSKTPLWKTVKLDFNKLSTGIDIYDIRVLRIDGGKSSSMEIGNNLLLDSVTEIVQGDFIYPNTALLGLKIKGTGQLSGSPPNVTTIIRGTKVLVPSLSGSETFDSCFWDASDNRWEYNNAERTWDNVTYEREYSENSMLCVRDLTLSSRYGLGSYINSADLYTSGIITSIKECHKSWSSGVDDLLSWWDRGGTDFDRNVIDLYTFGSITVDSTAKSVTLKSGLPVHGLKINLNSSLEVTRSHTISMTFSSLTQSSTVRIYGAGLTLGSNILLTSFAGVTASTISDTIIPIVSGITQLVITVSSTAVSTGVITDISLTPTTNLHNHTYNGVLDSPQAAQTALLEMCESFRCWPVWYSGTYNFVIDVDETPIHTLSVGNTEEFSQSFTGISSIYSKLIGQFADADKKYEMRSIIAKSTDSTLNPLNELSVGLKGLTNRRRAERELRFKLNKITNNTHVVNVKCGLDFIHGTAGDIINIQDDLPAWGIGGRVLDYNSTTITIDKEYTWDNTTASYLIRYQIANNSFVVATLTASATNSRVLTPASFPGTPKDDAVYAAGVSTTYVKPFRIISTERTGANEVSFTALEHTSSLYDAQTITVIEDNYSTLSNPLSMPGLPTNPSVTQLNPSLGIGFELKASPSINDTSVKEIVVQMSTVDDPTWEMIGTITVGSNSTKYVNNSLNIIPPHNLYHFRFFCRTAFKSGPVVEVRNVELDKNIYQLPMISGLRIKDSDVTSNSFSGKDVTITWNTTGSSYFSTNLSTFGYKIEVYHTSASKDNLLRTVFTKTEEYEYTLENNLEDSGLSTPYSTLIFVVFAVAQGLSDGTHRSITVTNSTPNAISGLTAMSTVGGVRFQWSKSTDVDFKNYYYGTKVNSGSWSSWSDYEDNAYFRTLTATEITVDNKSDVYIRVKAKDWYEQLSTEASTVASANTISDNIFQLVGSKSAGITGTVASLYDSDIDSGGVLVP